MGADDATAALVRAVDRVLTHADERRRLGVRANADTPADATRARKLGAQGIGLCRTEHMFLGTRRTLIERLILANSRSERDEALDALLPLQRNDFIEMLETMDGLPVTIRLLDPPLHEFLPNLTELSVKVALENDHGDVGPDVDIDHRLLTAVERLHEANPMLGLRGVRLGLLTPGLTALQIRAITEAAIAQIKAGKDPRVEIMVPLVGSVRELDIVRAEAEALIEKLATEAGVTLTIPIGTMIELPRAALTAGRIAESADFFSFGTNDLTQTTWGSPATTSRPRCSWPTWTRASSPSRRSRRSMRTVSAGWCGSPRRKAGPPSRPSSWVSAVSTAATRSRSTSSTIRVWTTCPARRSGSRWPGWRPAARRVS